MDDITPVKCRKRMLKLTPSKSIVKRLDAKSTPLKNANVHETVLCEKTGEIIMSAPDIPSTVLCQNAFISDVNIQTDLSMIGCGPVQVTINMLVKAL